MAAEIHGDRLARPAHASGSGSGFMADLKDHKLEVIIGGATLLVTVFFLSRGKSGSTTPNASGLLPNNTASGGGGNNGVSAPPTNTVTTDTLASALASISAHEQSDFQTLQAQMRAFGQSTGGLGGASGSNGAGGVAGFPSGSNVPGGTGYPSGQVVQNNGNAITNALQARNQISDSAIVQFFANLSLPSWIGLQYVAENLRLPWSPGSTPTSSQLSNFNSWLDSHGYRNASTNSFTPVVSSGTVPANVQNELNAAYGSAG